MALSFSHVSYQRLPRAVLLAALLGSLGNLLIYFITAAFNLIPADFSVLNPITVILASTAGAAAGGIALAVLGRLTNRAVLIFRIGGTLAALISLAGPLRAGAGIAGGIPGLPVLPQIEAPLVIALMAMHLVAAAAVILTLTLRGVEVSS